MVDVSMPRSAALRGTIKKYETGDRKRECNRTVRPFSFSFLHLLLPLLLIPKAHAQDHAYTLHARLDPEAHTVEGEGEIVWRNESRVAQDHLFVHLYLNAFADEESVFMRESNRQLRGVRFRGTGGIEVTRFELADGRDLLAGADDEVEENDHTQLRVPLPEPVEPGASIRIRMTWTSTLPPVFARSGYHGEFHMVAQWFPKIARLEREGEWASFPYHGHGEFYADFAHYALTVDVPAGWDVGATGRPLETSEDGDRVRRVFDAERVHDAAFAAAPWFQERNATHQRADGSEVRVRVLFPPGFESSVRTHVQVTLDGLAHYGARFGEYPYDVLTVIVPPRGADGAAGMEYPMLFVTAGPWFQMDGLPIALHDEVTAHELGHQWFQGLVASNEVAWPMLDEGLTEWVTGDLLHVRHGRAGSGIEILGMAIDGFELRRGFALRGKRTPPPGRAAYEFRGSSYGRSVYGRTSTVLETVARTWGRTRFYRALGSYARSQRFGHPKPDDLFRAFDAEYGSWMSRRILRPALMDGAIGTQRVVRFEPGTTTRVVVQREGIAMPSHVALRRGREVRRFAWPSERARMELEVDGEWDAVEVDPDRHNLMDPERRDDAMGNAPRSPFARFVSLVQSLLGAVGP